MMLGKLLVIIFLLCLRMPRTPMYFKLFSDSYIRPTGSFMVALLAACAFSREEYIRAQVLEMLHLRGRNDELAYVIS